MSADRRAAPLGMIVVTLIATARASAQDFASPRPPWPVDLASAYLESGVPTASPAPGVDAVLVRWYGLPDLTTRAVAAKVGWRSLRLAAGVSQTGAPDWGWSAAALAAGAAQPSGGAGLRAAARRDRTTTFSLRARPEEVGFELGGGAWAAAGSGLFVWASAPQLATLGIAPPLRRGLELGGVARSEGFAIWVTRAAVGGAWRGGRSEHGFGLSVEGGSMAGWVRARDQPLRGGLGFRVLARRAVRVAVEVEGHPVLSETVRLGVAFGSGEPGAPGRDQDVP